MPQPQTIPIDVTGSSTFGRYPKISISKTYNMYISDDFLVNYAGYQKVINLIDSTSSGRALFYSVRGGFMIAVISSSVYRINQDLSYLFVGNLDSATGLISVDENLSSQICICDGANAYIYNYDLNSLTKQTLIVTLILNGIEISYKLIPNYVEYHNTFFLFGSSQTSPESSKWYSFIFDTPTTIKFNTEHALQTKPDIALAVKRVPSKSDNVLVIGQTVCDLFTNVGGVENYRKITSFNIDNGCVSVSTIASNEDFICFLAQNENNSPFILVTNGSSWERISSDGIDFLLSSLIRPDRSNAFFYRQDGHLFYQITFYDPSDNLSLFYDFTTKKFFHATDEKTNFYPASSTTYFFGANYFVSHNDGGLYQFDTNLITYNYVPNTEIGEEIPRIRVTSTTRLPDYSLFRIGMFSFLIEQGVTLTQPPSIPVVQLSFSKNGNQTFSNPVTKQLNENGRYKNQIKFWRLGYANEFTIQLRFYGYQRFVCNNGYIEIY